MSEIRTDTINNASGDNDSGIDLSTNDQVSIKTANTTAVTVDASQNVGIGTSSPVAGSKLTINDSAFGGLQFQSAGSDCGYIGVNSNTLYVGGGSTVAFHTGNAQATDGTERMRIDSFGIVNINTTVQQLDNNEKVRISGKTSITNSSDWTLLVNRDGSDGNLIAMMRGTAVVGSVSVTTSSTSYNTSSDHRLKENVVEMTDATTRLKQLQPKRFNFIADADTTVDGFLAHEVQSVVPEAITGTHNEVDADGNPVYQGIDQSKLVPLLVKTIQELEARITALENA